MVEGGAYEVSEDTMINAILAGHEAIKLMCKAQQELVDRCAKPKMELKPQHVGEAHEKLLATVKEVVWDELNKDVHSNMVKTDFYPAMADLCAKMLEDERILAIIGKDEEQDPALVADAKAIFSDYERTAMREMILNEDVRLDGRTTTEVRPIEIELAKPRVSWSARSAPRPTNSATKACRAKAPRATCCITTSRRTAWVNASASA